MKGRISGCKPDVPDGRDLRYRADYLKISRLGQLLRSFVLPDKVDLREEANVPVLDQGNIGSCVDNALVTCMGHVAADQGCGTPLYSRLFAYGNARGWTPSDDGSTLRDAIKGVDRFGIPLEAMWPYDTARWQERPPQEVWDAALHRHEIGYYRLLTHESMLMSLARDRKPFLFGAAIFDSFHPDADHAIPMPKPGDRSWGGHAMTVMGYDKARQAFLVRNSWGTGWGDEGHCWMPFAYLHPPDTLVYQIGGLFYDAWTIRAVTA